MSMPLPRLELDWHRQREREGASKWTDNGQTSGYIRVELVASCDRFVLTWIPCHHRCHWQRRRLYLWPGRPSLSRLYQTENLPFPYHRVTAIKVTIIIDVLYNMRGTYLIIIVKLQVTQTRLKGWQGTLLVGGRTTQYILNHLGACRIAGTVN